MAEKIIMATKTTFRACPVCNCRNAEVLLHIPFTLPEDSPLPEAYDIVACKACNFVYADTPGSQQDYDRYYHEHSKYEDPTVATGGSHDPYDHARIKAQADRISTEIGKDCNTLDIGCASGGLLLELRAKGYKFIHGVDGACSCIEQLSKQGVKSTLLRLSELGQGKLDGLFDVIILSHVLEHVVELQKLLEAAKSLLAPNGKIYIETPDASRYDNDMFVPYYFFDAEHINHFDVFSLGQLAKHSGLYPTKGGQTTLEVAEGMHYPACWVWLAPNESAENRSILEVQEPALNERIRAYIANSAASEHYPILAALEHSQTPVIVWGAGSFAQRLFSRTALRHCNIVGIADKDSNKRGRTFAGHTVSTPEALLTTHPDATVLVVAAVQFEAIEREARGLSPSCTILKLFKDKA